MRKRNLVIGIVILGLLLVGVLVFIGISGKKGAEIVGSSLEPQSGKTAEAKEELEDCITATEEEYVKEVVIKAPWGECEECFFDSLRPQWFTLSEGGNIYIFDTHFKKINIYDSDGQFINSIFLSDSEYRYVDDSSYIGFDLSPEKDTR